MDRPPLSDPKAAIDNLVREARKADREDKEMAQLFQLLVAHEGWKRYVALLEKRIQAMGDMVLSPAGSVNGAIALEYVKGAMSGMVMARDLPSVIIAAMKAAGPATDGDE